MKKKIKVELDYDYLHNHPNRREVEKKLLDRFTKIYIEEKTDYLGKKGKKHEELSTKERINMQIALNKRKRVRNIHKILMELFYRDLAKLKEDIKSKI